MPSFKSIEGVWFAKDQVTQKELKAAGIDHLGIHVSEDPYIKQMEYVTGIPRHELMQGHQRNAMERMMQQMQQNQMIMTMLLAGDKDGALQMLKAVQAKAIEDQQRSDESAKLDPIKRAQDEFEASMKGHWEGDTWVPTKNDPYKKVPEKTDDLKNVPEQVEERLPINASVVRDPELGGFAKPGEKVAHRELKKGK